MRHEDRRTTTEFITDAYDDLVRKCSFERAYDFHIHNLLLLKDLACPMEMLHALKDHEFISVHDLEDLETTRLTHRRRSKMFVFIHQRATWESLPLVFQLFEPFNKEVVETLCSRYDAVNKIFGKPDNIFGIQLI